MIPVKLELLILALLPVSVLHAQGYGQAGGGAGALGSGNGRVGGGAAIARVAVAPSGSGGGGFGGGQSGFAGGTQGFGNSGGGGGLHGVTRRTFMAEPNILAAQYFTVSGVNVAPVAAPGLGTTGAGFYGAGAPANRQTSRLAVRTPTMRPSRVAAPTQMAGRSGNRSTAAPPAVTAGIQAAEEAATAPAFSATQIAGVMPADPATQR